MWRDLIDLFCLFCWVDWDRVEIYIVGIEGKIRISGYIRYIFSTVSSQITILLALMVSLLLDKNCITLNK